MRDEAAEFMSSHIAEPPQIKVNGTTIQLKGI